MLPYPYRRIPGYGYKYHSSKTTALHYYPYSWGEKMALSYDLYFISSSTSQVVVVC